MAVSKEELLKLYDRLHDKGKDSLLEYAKFLAEHHVIKSFDWKKWHDNLPDEDEFISASEQEALSSEKEDFVPWEEVKNELGL